MAPTRVLRSDKVIDSCLYIGASAVLVCASVLMPIDELAISGANPRRERETSAEAGHTQTGSHDLTRCTAPHLHHDWAPFGSSAALITDTASAPVWRACAQAERAATSRDALQRGTIRCTAEQAPQPSTCAIELSTAALGRAPSVNARPP